MSNQQGQAVGGSCVGGVLGALVGIVGGIALSGLLSDDHKPTGFVDGFFSFLGSLIRPFLFGGIGGVVGAVGGAALGAALATSSRAPQAKTPTHPETSGAVGSPAQATESTESELARLRERLAELEAQKRDDASH